MTRIGQVEVYDYYSMHLGPRYESAGIGLQWDGDQTAGVHFRVEPPEEYRGAILRGVEHGMAARFPDFPSSRSICITRAVAHEVDSSQRAFYRAARMVIDQLFTLTQTNET
jgi:hypothetical protein